MTEIPHGTSTGYTHHKCRCELCVKANRDRQRKYRQKLYEQGYFYIKGYLHERPKRKR